VLVFLGGFRLERKQVFAGIILVVTHFSVRRPKVGVNIEEIHVYGYLDAFAF